MKTVIFLLMLFPAWAWSECRSGFVNARKADLRDANLTGANLQGAKVNWAEVTKEQAEYLKSQGLSGFVVVE